MKKFIPILCLTAFTFAVQNCNNRDEDLVRENYSKEVISNTSQKRSDTTTKQPSIVDPDPPVRDGDNWRTSPAPKQNTTNKL